MEMGGEVSCSDHLICEKGTHSHYRMLDGTQDQSGHSGEKKNAYHC